MAALQATEVTMIELGQTITIHYPTTTHVRYFDAVPRRPRTIQIVSIRDLVHEPLTIAEFLRRPYVRRSRLLVRAIDLDTGRYRQFYTGNSAEMIATSQLKIGLYDPGQSRPAEVLFRAIDPTVRDRKLLIRAIDRWASDNRCDISRLRIFADDLRLVS